MTVVAGNDGQSSLIYLDDVRMGKAGIVALKKLLTSEKKYDEHLPP